MHRPGAVDPQSRRMLLSSCRSQKTETTTRFLSALTHRQRWRWTLMDLQKTPIAVCAGHNSAPYK